MNDEPKLIILDRRDGQQLIEFLDVLVEDGNLPDWVRREALWHMFGMRAALVYGYTAGFGEVAGHHAHSLPIGFDTRHFFADTVEGFIIDTFGGEPGGLEEISVLLVRKAAADVDNQQFSTDFRLQRLDTLAYLMDSIRRRNSGDDEDEEQDEDEPQIVRSTNDL